MTVAASATALNINSRRWMIKATPNYNECKRTTVVRDGCGRILLVLLRVSRFTRRRLKMSQSSFFFRLFGVAMLFPKLIVGFGCLHHFESTICVCLCFFFLSLLFAVKCSTGHEAVFIGLHFCFFLMTACAFFFTGIKLL